MATSPSIVWFRLDIRLSDHPALHAAIQRGAAVLPVYIHAPEEEGSWAPGAASRWWLHHSLRSLDRKLRDAGSRLLLLPGPSLEALRQLIRVTGASAVFFSRRHEPAAVGRDKRVADALDAEGVEVRSFPGALLIEPGSITNQSGKPFRVFSAFWRACHSLAAPDPPISEPRTVSSPPRWPKSIPLDALELLPRIDWAAGLRSHWQPGSDHALSHLQQFLDRSLEDYETHRDRPGLPGTSRLSPHLHFGEVSPRQIWHALRQQAERRGIPQASWRGGRFITELGWREFAHHLLHHFPAAPSEPLRPEFRRFPWRRSPAWLLAWQKGQTGYPIVDAGMRELWATGWMHNRARMIVASFLVKDLLISWQEGARWFWDTLVDADLAQNTLGWQWTAGCGADAAPYFRIFNPVLQGEKFDPRGDYVRRWCPELDRLPDRWIHRPWEAPANILERAAVKFGQTYPCPVVSHAIAREVALEAFAKLR